MEGRHGQAISLTDGVHAVVNLPACVKKGEFTLAFWMKPLRHPDDGLSHPIVEIPSRPEDRDNVGWATGQFYMGKGWSETISPNHFYGVVDAGIAKLHLKPNQWMHVVVCYSVKGKFISGYTNGEGLRRPQTKMRPLDVHQNRMWLGSRDNGRGGGEIVLDDLRIYDHAIEQSKIPEIAGADFPPPRDYLLLGNQCDPTRAVETPHTKWAKPYAGGQLRVLCVGEGVRARDFVELAQRLDMELLTVTGPAIHSFTLKNRESFQAMGRRVEKRLAAGNIDCVVIGSFGWNLFLESTRSVILEYVAKGGGLLIAAPRCTGDPGDGRNLNIGAGVWVGWERTPEARDIEAAVSRLDRVDEEYLTATIPWRLNSHFATAMAHSQPWMLFRGGSFDNGRVLLYDVPTDSTYGWVSLTPALCWSGSFDQRDYDYALGVAAKAVLLAAGKASPVRIQSIRYGSDRQFFRKVPVGLAGRWRVNVLNLGPEPVSVVIRLRARTRGSDAAFEAAKRVTLKPGANRVDLPHTMDRIGQVFADVSVLLDGKVTDWATGGVRTVHGNPWFTSLVADRAAYEAGDRPQITASVALKTYGKSFGETGSLRWRLLDCYGRVVGRGERPVAFDPYDQIPATVAWALPGLPDSSLQYQLAVDLIRRGRTTDQKVLELTCRRSGVDDFIFHAWGGCGAPPDCLGAILLRDRYGLAGVGVNFSGDALTDGPDLMSDIVRSALRRTGRINMRPWIYATHLAGNADREKMRDLDLADPQLRVGLQVRLREVARLSKPYSPLFYGLGDEVCQGPPNAAASGHELEAFRRHLKAKYGKLEVLNKVWGTDYKYWRDIQCHTPELLDAGKANLHAYNEMRAFRDTLFADLVGACTRAIQSVDPGANVGTEGIFGLTHHYGNFDYSKLCETSTFMGQYALGMEMDMVRSFQKPGDLLGCWYNYHKLDRPYNLLGPWHVLLRGARLFGWYTIYEGSQYAALNPDFTPTEQFGWTWEELEPLLAGIGKLVIGLERDDPGVYVIYEHRNLDRHSSCFLSLITFVALLQDIGLRPAFVSSRQIEKGALARASIKALVLPRQFAMRPPVADAIRKFALNGGAVVADEAVALSDGHKRYDTRPLDDLFAGKDARKGRLLPQAEQDLPAWKTHEKAVGKGATLLLGGSPAEYRRRRMGLPGQLMRRVLIDFLAKHGVRPTFRVRPVNRPFLPIDVVSYHDGTSRYVGLQRDYKIMDQSAQKFEVRGSAKAHVYDVRAGAYLGHADAATVELEVARGALLAFLPYKATALRVDGLPAIVTQGVALDLSVALSTEGDAPAGGVFRIEVIAPGGSRVPALCRKVRSTGGVARVPLRIAFSDPVGKWTLSITDITTGTRKDVSFEAKPAE